MLSAWMTANSGNSRQQEEYVPHSPRNVISKQKSFTNTGGEWWKPRRHTKTTKKHQNQQLETEKTLENDVGALENQKTTENPKTINKFELRQGKAFQ